jgi:L-lactate dehydrogenase complex protein LldG
LNAWPMMTAIRTDVHIVEPDAWLDRLKELAREKGWKRLLYGPGGTNRPGHRGGLASRYGGLPELVAYTEPVETFKDDLFQIDAGITSVARGWPKPAPWSCGPHRHEPRLMSLVPPVHVAVLDADTIYNSLAEMMAAENWAAGMPTNALLISGPSKTADIEFTLVFGVHGPKELIVILRK